MVPGLSGGKMSASDASSKIDLLDSVDEVAVKVRRAVCAPGVVENNGVLAFARMVLFPLLEGKPFIIRRKVKFGGDVEYTTYDKLEDDYRTEKLWPLDLKVAVIDALNKLLDPIRQIFADPEMQRIRREAYPNTSAL